MYALVLLGVCSLLISLLLTPLCRDLFLRWNFVDLPDRSRKLHSHPIPRVGGIAILVAYVCAFGIVLAVAGDGPQLLREHRDLVWALLPAVLIIFAVGVLDDLAGMRATHKLAGQVLGASWAVFMGIRISGFRGEPADAWWLAPLTVLWLVGCINAFNLIDGVDGLAAGVGLFATLTTLLAAILNGDTGLVIATVPLVGCLMGFLRYNFNPASIFLGDCGSMLIGLLLGCYAVVWSQKSATLLGMVAPMMALAIPLFDVGLSVSRRFLRSQPIFGADRGHIHHRLLARGLKPRAVSLTLYAVCGVAALLSLLQSVYYHEAGGLVIVLFCAAAWLGIQRLGYVEFSVARQLVTGGAFRRMLQEEICLHNFRQALLAVTSVEDCWEPLRLCCRDLRFRSVAMQAAGVRWDDSFVGASGEVDGGEEAIWRFEAAVPGSFSVEIGHSRGIAPSAALLSVVDTLFDALGSHQIALPNSSTESAAILSRRGRRMELLPPRSAIAS